MPQPDIPQPIKTQPIPKEDALLREKFAEEIVKQGDRLDDLAKHLLTIILSISGVYAAVLKLSIGKAALPLTPLLIITFMIWLAALLLTLFAIFPKSYRVDPTVIRRNPAFSTAGALSIEEFYQQSAKRKYGVLALASVCFFGGVVCAILSMIFC